MSSDKSVALISGASAGLGVEFARQLAKRGRRLVLTARREDRLEELATELGNARAVAADLAEAGSADRLMADIEAAGERVELLVNNAGFGLKGRFAELDAARQRQMIDLNIGALTDLCRAVAPGMMERKSGGILNVASTAAFQPGPGMAVYFATKAYVLSFTEALHEELKPFGISVSALCPGPTRTEFGAVAGFGENGAFDRFSADSASVVRAGLEGLERNRAVVVPGWINKVGASSTRFVPRPLVRKIAGAIKY
ncbi:SDR family oxidoreductase [Sphingomonas sp.]|uniref:SDR family NAD(P)-dependent oxidoreductase n=1 Tax=Sphingomonas sp. TaxID=28214 RepID=UPI001792F2D3|nr:SDR family oxidoreductase [Sphingomonas sp.]MBA3511690.1 SDR family oxidoreductase [Sphingomonas sp.]